MVIQATRKSSYLQGKAIIYHIPVEGKEGVGEGKGVWFPKRLMGGGGGLVNFEKAEKERGLKL